MANKLPDDVKQEAVRLRVEERLSIHDIARRTGLSVGTLSTLLRDYPLSEEEVSERVSEAAIRSNARRRYNPDRSKFAAMVEGENLSTQRKGQIAETAVRYRLHLLGFKVWEATAEGERVDCLVSRPGGNKYIRLQIKWAKRDKWGRPVFALRNGEHGKIRRLTQADCDFVVGYDLETDTAFVMPVDVCEGKHRKACDPQYAEAWHLLGI